MASLISLTDFEDSHHRILSPAVGFCALVPAEGTYVSGGAFIGRVRVLNSWFDLYLPEDVFGRVLIEKERDKFFHVEYGQELFRLNPQQNLSDSTKQTSKSGSVDHEEVDEGHVITAFTTGIFYGRPSPDSQAYVEEGQKIEKGKVLGLIEVMKTFNLVIFQGTDSSESGRIKKILVNDAQEVKLNQPLFLVEVGE